MTRHIGTLVYCSVAFAICSSAWAEDWPTFGHDNHRTCVTSEKLNPPLSQSWVFKATHPPQPAWPEPAKQDFFHHHHNLRPTVTYDRVFHVVGAGDKVYFGSSADDKVYALDALTGQVRWSFFAEGPIRLAPTIVGRRVYVASDDGCVYCLSADNGRLLWKFKAGDQNRMIPGNGRMISVCPVRTSLVVDGANAYFAAGLFPNQETYLFALNGEDGSVTWRQKVGISAQGYMLASDERLYVPTGRTSPAVFARADGRFSGELPSAGGAYALLTEEALVAGPGRGAKELNASDLKARDTIATFGGLRMVVKGSMAYMQSENRLSAFNRHRYMRLSRDRNILTRRYNEAAKQLKKLDKAAPEAQQLQQEVQTIKVKLSGLSRELKDCYLWEVECAYPHSMIVAGDIIFAGGENKVAALSTKDGKEIWNSPVTGRAYGLSVMNGGLYLSTDRGYIYCFRSDANGDATVITARINTNPYSYDQLTDVYTSAASHIVDQTGIKKGYCLVLDSGEGRLAYELARLTDLKIIGVEENADKVAVARQALDTAGLYGRVVIHHGSCTNLPYTEYFANLIVFDEALRSGKLPDSAKGVFKFLRPYGGVIALGVPEGKHNKRNLKEWIRACNVGWKLYPRSKIFWAMVEREELEGAGEWTHTYAEPGNSACSRDELVKGTMAIQWFGRPGPRDMIDRHHRNTPPLFKDGRLFVPGDCVLFAVDAYNGTILWKAEIPNSRRLGVFLDSGSMAVDEQFLYVVAENKCYGFNVRTGHLGLTHTMPQLIKDEPRHWGYIAYCGDFLFGSGRKRDASYTETSYEADKALWHRNMKLVVSEYLFAMDKQNGKLRWKYKDGLILNTTIAVGGGRIYFVETNNQKALNDVIARCPVKTLFEGGEQYLVALDIKNGSTVFKRTIDVNDFQEPVYLNYAKVLSERERLRLGAPKDIVLLSGSKLAGNSVRYSYYAFDARSGRTCWNLGHDTGLAKDGGHGEYNRHPTIIDDTVYAWPYAYNLMTGRRVEGWKFDRRGHGCGGVSASAQCLFWRGANPWMYDLGPNGGAIRLNRVTRPGCWINIIPAGGLVLIPESSSGCTCGFPLQTSMAFVPKQALK